MAPPAAPLLTLLLSAMAPSALAMAVDCAPGSPPSEGPVPWVQSWMPPALRHQLGTLLPQDHLPQPHQAHQDVPPHNGHQQPLAEATGDGDDPGFCPL